LESRCLRNIWEFSFSMMGGVQSPAPL